MHVKYSIIIPIYNAETYLDECLMSLKNQIYENFEVILVDDGSTDNSCKIYNKYEKEDKRFKVFKKKNGGVSSARNLGLLKASGKYILFVDSDDYCDNKLLKIIDENIDNNIDIISFGYYKKYKNIICDVKPNFKETINDYQLGFYEGEEILGYLWNKVFLNEIIKFNKIQFNTDIHYSEDLIFVTDYFKYVNKFLVIDDCLYFYRMRKNSATFNFYNEKSVTSLDAYNYLYNKSDNQKIKEIIKFEYLKNYYRLKKIIDKNNNYKIREDFLLNEKTIINRVSLKDKITYGIIKYLNPIYILIKKLKEIKYKLYY